MKGEKNILIPEKLKNEEKWLWSRRLFFKKLAMAGVAVQLGFIESCMASGQFDPLSKKQFELLTRVQSILFPAGEPGPGAADFQAEKYVLWMLNDQRMDPEENEYLIQGLDKLEEESLEQHKTSFLALSAEEQVSFMDHLLTTDWGESWLSVNLTYIFEAMISDPIYGFNAEEQGWAWLKHVPGLPRPDMSTMYDAIFHTVKSKDL
jgi:gluconate 2-dehydrogenase gamma chain